MTAMNKKPCDIDAGLAPQFGSGMGPLLCLSGFECKSSEPIAATLIKSAHFCGELQHPSMDHVGIPQGHDRRGL